MAENILPSNWMAGLRQGVEAWVSPEATLQRALGDEQQASEVLKRLTAGVRTVMGLESENTMRIATVSQQETVGVITKPWELIQVLLPTDEGYPQAPSRVVETSRRRTGGMAARQEAAIDTATLVELVPVSKREPLRNAHIVATWLEEQAEQQTEVSAKVYKKVGMKIFREQIRAFDRAH